MGFHFASTLRAVSPAFWVSTLILLLCLDLVGCAIQNESRAQGFQDVREYSFIVVGKTTRSQLVEKFGHPSQTALNSAGIKTLTWGHSSRIVDPRSYIPFVGGFLAGSSTEHYSLSVVVNGQDVVVDFYFTRGLYKHKSRV